MLEDARMLRSARARAGLSQRQVAARAGVRQPVVAAYEGGRRRPTVPMLRRLLRASGHELQLAAVPVSRLPDPAHSGRRLELVLGLADHLPRRTRPKELDFPRLPA